MKLYVTTCLLGLNKRQAKGQITLICLRRFFGKIGLLGLSLQRISTKLSGRWFFGGSPGAGERGESHIKVYKCTGSLLWPEGHFYRLSSAGGKATDGQGDPPGPNSGGQTESRIPASDRWLRPGYGGAAHRQGPPREGLPAWELPGEVRHMPIALVDGIRALVRGSL